MKEIMKSTVDVGEHRNGPREWLRELVGLLADKGLSSAEIAARLKLPESVVRAANCPIEGIGKIG